MPQPKHSFRVHTTLVTYKGIHCLSPCLPPETQEAQSRHWAPSLQSLAYLSLLALTDSQPLAEGSIMAFQNQLSKSSELVWKVWRMACCPLIVWSTVWQFRYDWTNESGKQRWASWDAREHRLQRPHQSFDSSMHKQGKIQCDKWDSFLEKNWSFPSKSLWLCSPLGPLFWINCVRWLFSFTGLEDAQRK